MKKFLVILAVVVLAAVWFSLAPSKKRTTTVTNTAAAAPQYNQKIVINDVAFIPNEFTISPSQTIKVLLNNAGKSAHTFTFDKLDFSSSTVNPGQSKIVTFTVPAAPGRYPFHSADPADKNKGMTGTLIVQ